MGKTKQTAITKTEKPGAIAPLEDWEIQAQEKARADRAKEVIGIPRITHKGSIIKIGDQKVKDNKLIHVVVDYIFTKAFYEKEYDPNGPPQTPVCYAYAKPSEGEASMKPHPEASKKQHDQCEGCPWNKFKTAEKGKGKRCKDERKVACIVQISKPSDVMKAEVRQYSVPPGSLRNWANYLSALDEVTPTGDPRSVLTEMSTEASESGAYSLNFRATEKLDKEFYKAILARGPGLEAQMFAPWPQISEGEDEDKTPPKKKIKGQK